MRVSARSTLARRTRKSCREIAGRPPIRRDAMLRTLSASSLGTGGGAGIFGAAICGAPGGGKIVLIKIMLVATDSSQTGLQTLAFVNTAATQSRSGLSCALFTVSIWTGQRHHRPSRVNNANALPRLELTSRLLFTSQAPDT